MGKRRKPAAAVKPKESSEGLPEEELIFSGGEDSDNFDDFSKMGFISFEEISGKDAEELLSKVVRAKPLEKADEKLSKPKKKAEKAGKNDFKINETQEEVTLKKGDMQAWRKYPLDDSLLLGLKRQNFLKPTAVQEKTLEAFYGPHPGSRDIMGTAPTGSGKTLAFGLPILNFIAKREVKEGESSLAALIIAPTRELALQIKEHLLAISPSVRLAILIGGMSSEKQERLLSRDPQIIIGTPGRLNDCIGSDEILANKISHLPFLVIDEADRLVESGHFKELDSIFSFVYKDPSYKERHTFLFSATLDFDPSVDKAQTHGKKAVKNPLEQLRAKVKFSGLAPTMISLGAKHKVADKIAITKVYCLPEEKDLFLMYHLLTTPFTKALVFVNAIDILKRVTPVLQVFDIPCSTLHAQMQQRQRLQHLDKFKAASKMVLVTSDVSARGLDIPTVDQVIHYHLPKSTDTFVHRCGRTGRAERSGSSLALISPQELELELTILKKLGLTSIPESKTIDLADVERFKDLVEIARQIETAQGKLTKTNKERTWEAKAAEDLGIELDGTFGGKKRRKGDDDDGEDAAARKAKAQISALKNQFNALRKQLRL